MRRAKLRALAHEAVAEGGDLDDEEFFRCGHGFKKGGKRITKNPKRQPSTQAGKYCLRRAKRLSLFYREGAMDAKGVQKKGREPDGSTGNALPFCNEHRGRCLFFAPFAPSRSHVQP